MLEGSSSRSMRGFWTGARAMGDRPTLAAGERAAALADLSAEALTGGWLGFVEARRAQRPREVVRRFRLAATGGCFADVAVKDHGILRHVSHLAALALGFRAGSCNATSTMGCLVGAVEG
ncbi:MAG: hypothetical protein IPQ01_08620 [Zoogloea sp.]|nr:hypothetical protein [Zoogloea sp.]